MPAQRSDIPKMIEVAAPVPGVEQPKTTTKSGTANVTTPAGTFACNTMESTTEMPGMKSWSKFATSADVPNGLVKMESKTEMGETTVTSTITLVALSKA